MVVSQLGLGRSSEIHSKALAMSFARASCRMGMVAVTEAILPGSCSAGRAMCVTVQPGSTMFTRPNGSIRTISFLSVRTRPVRPALLAA